ncbi:MAG: cysteine desulfurase [Methanomassiliicoccales archaeon]|nr:cysteine desulfurase [Methanomassiliicoccales archaeon]
MYMDYASASPVDPRVSEAMLPFVSERPGNPSSIHFAGAEAREAVEFARRQVAELINAENPGEIVFTSGATESINMAIKGVAFRNADKGKRLITTTIEHMSVLNTVKLLTTRGFDATLVPVDGFGFVDPARVDEAITKDTTLISVSYANGEVGSVQPIKDIGKIAREHGAYLHVDGVAAVGRTPVDVRVDSIDLMSISSNDICGPKGVGALYVKKGVKIEPLIHGGGQERGLRSGSENVPGIVGFGKAAEMAGKEMSGEIARLKKFRDRMIREIGSGTKGAHLNGHPEKRLANNVNFRFDYIEGEALILRLNDMGIAAATSSACTSKTLEPSHVLRGMGVPPEEAQGTLLLTMGRWTSDEDVNYVLENVPGIVDLLRKMSPLNPETEA